MTAPGTIVATQIGITARPLLADKPEAKVWGATSRGMFIHLSSRWIIYLTPEVVPGPLTLNLSGDTGHLKAIRNGDVVKVSANQIDFPKSGIQIDITEAVTWQTLPPAGTSIHIDECRLRLRAVCRRAIQQFELEGRSASLLFQAFLAMAGLQESSPPPDDLWHALIVGLVNAREEKSAGNITRCLQAFLGLGSGLTPSGDDLVIGFLLALNRWGTQIAPGVETNPINVTLVSTAYIKTTTLSANLIECAAQGQANQRLITSLDGVMTGSPDAQQCSGLLASWGNTSGLDALTGMGIAIG